MKKLIQILIIVFAFTTVFGQEKKDSLPKQKEGKWAIGLSFSPNYSYRKTTLNETSLTNALGGGQTKIINYKKSNQFESPAFNWSSYLIIKRKIYKSFFCSIGLGLQNIKYKTGIIDTLVQSYSSISASSRDTSFNNTSLIFLYKYFSFPLMIEYRRNIGKNIFHVDIGITKNYFREGKVIEKNIQSNYSSPFYADTFSTKGSLIYPEREKGYKASTWGVISIGVDIRSKNIIFSIDPSFTYSFTPLKRHINDIIYSPNAKNYNIFLYSFALNLTIYYLLK